MNQCTKLIKNKAKGLGVTTFAITKLEERGLFREQEGR